MMRGLTMRLLGATMLVSCMTLTTVAAMDGPNPTKLTVVTLDISGRKLHLPLPVSKGTNDLDEVRRPIATKIDIEKPFSAPVTLVRDTWDWKSLLHLYGSITITASVHAVPEGIDSSCIDSLKRMLTEEFESKRRESIRLGGKAEYLPRYSVHPSLFELTNGAALVYERSANYDFSKRVFGENGGEYYVAPVSSNSYLEIGFEILGGGDPSIKSNEWRPQADAIEQAILKGIRFEGEWPKLRDCRSLETKSN